MSTLNIGFLFEKININYHLKKYEIYKFIDYVVGIKFTNTEDIERINIISGKNNYGYASILFSDKKMSEDKYTFLSTSLDKAIETNDNKVNFEIIYNEIISKTGKYYVKDKDKNGTLKSLNNKELITLLENKEDKVFEKNTDISTMYDSIKKTIISQDEQIMQILTALFKNQKVINSDLEPDLVAKLKENILIYGSTGTGKTEILKRISKLYNIPIVIEDATSLSETGYVGRKITDMLDDLCLAANGDIQLAEKGILVIDEFDKLAEKSNDNQSHVSRLGVQRSLLKLLDGSLFYFGDKQFDTSKLTIVCLGAFTGISNNDDYQNITSEDFMNYGIMRELIGRFSKTIAMNPLLKEDIIKILKYSDFSPINTYKKLFEILEVNFEFTDEFIDYIAELAVAKKSGARSLKTVFDDCISSALFRIFAGEYSGISLIRPDKQTEKPYILTRKK